MQSSGSHSGLVTTDGEATVVEGEVFPGFRAPLAEEEEGPRFLSRYVVIAELGRGGMGRVYRAYDPKLEREVALKRLWRVTADARARLVREAQAMAQLSHPNVLPVYDVDTEAGRLFIAMELCRGQTLREWLDQARPWDEVLERFVQAGRGLEAAHDAGLVHRDFKPANVLLGDDGRVRVMDFGLARGTGSESSSGPIRLPPVRDSTSGEILVSADERSLDSLLSMAQAGVIRRSDSHPMLSSLTEELTQVGAVVGTPSYMSPEQHLGRTADPRSDQYGYCVALWEALYGRRPFSARDPIDWYKVKTTEAPVTADDRDVPRWLHAVVRRGLASRPSDRFSSMTELLHALGRGQRRRRSSRWLAGGLGVLGLGATIYAATPDKTRCGGARARLEGVWDDAIAAEAERALLGSGVSYASDTWARIRPQLEGYATVWAASHAEVCETARRGSGQDEALMDARMRCLEGRRQSLRALARTLVDADARVVERATAAVAELPALERCADPEFVLASAPRPEDPAVAAEVAALEERLADIKALDRAGRTAQALPDAQAVVEQADALGYGPLRVQARHQLGELEEHLGHYTLAADDFEAAFFEARRWGEDKLEGSAAIKLSHVLGERRGQPEDGQRWLRFARSTLDRVEDPDLEAAYLNHAGLLLGDLGHYDRAVPMLEQALELREATLGPRHPVVAGVLNNLALLHQHQGEYEQAMALHGRALEIREEVLGPEHPAVGNTLLNLSAVHKSRARYEEALAEQLRALAIYENAYGREHPHAAGSLINLGTIYEARGEHREALRSYGEAVEMLSKTQGEHHPNVAGTLANIGNVHRALGDDAQALRFYLRSLHSFEKTLGPDDALVSTPLVNLGRLAFDRGDYDEATRHLRRALRIMERTAGLAHPKVGTIYSNLGDIHAAKGEHREALRLYRLALEVREASLGAEHPDVGSSLWRLGQTWLALEAPAAAVEPLERAIAVWEDSDDIDAQLAEARFDLARARWERGEREPARALARQAREGFIARAGAAPDGVNVEALERVDRWLAEAEQED